MTDIMVLAFLTVLWSLVCIFWFTHLEERASLLSERIERMRLEIEQANRDVKTLTAFARIGMEAICKDVEGLEDVVYTGRLPAIKQQETTGAAP